jgi:hypothetical protein
VPGAGPPLPTPTSTTPALTPNSNLKFPLKFVEYVVTKAWGYICIPHSLKCTELGLIRLIIEEENYF